MKEQDSNPKNPSRRKFIKGVGTGVIGGAMLPNLLGSQPREDDSSAHQGKVPLYFKVNGRPIRLLVNPQATLVQVLRDQLNLTGTKIVCNHGECGSCTVLLNGTAVYSCHMLALDAAGKEVLTIEGLLTGEKLHPLQEAFVKEDGLQCGFCTPGQIMAAYALLLKYPNPTEEQVKQEMSGNICRCSAYPNIVKSVMAAAEKLSNKKHLGG